MKTIAETLGVARSNLIERRDDAKPKRGPQDRPGDLELSADIRRLVDQRPTYGYRRIAALLKRERRDAGGCRHPADHLAVVAIEGEGDAHHLVVPAGEFETV